MTLKALMGRGALVASAAVLLSSSSAVAQNVPALQELGKRVFFDNISNPPRQSCSTCHVAANGWTSGVAGFNKNSVAIPGADPRTIGGRKPPSNAYASMSPPFGTAPATLTQPPLLPPALACGLGIGPFCTGGIFWDGRAEGRASPFVGLPNVDGTGAIAHVGTEIFKGNTALELAYGRFIGPSADQALGPFPNDVEQNVPDGNDHGLPGAEAVCTHVASQTYSELYTKAWGEPINCATDQVISFKRIALAISAWQHSSEVNSFSSRRDTGARTVDGNGRTVLVMPFTNLTAQENLGHDLFYGRNDSGLNPSLKSANCALCHNSHDSKFFGPGSQGDELDQVYTDFAYHHIGLPANYDLANFVEQGDTGILGHSTPSVVFDPLNPNATPMAGHFKTPTLRNVDRRGGVGFTKTFMHNGYFKSLEQVVHFYNTSIKLRDPVNCPAGTPADVAIARNCWPAAEFDTPNQAGLLGLLGDLGLTADEEAALVAFLRSLSDTQTVKQPAPYTPSRSRKEAQSSTSTGGGSTGGVSIGIVP